MRRTKTSPTGRSRVLQIHPTRRCNLRCLHCYSSSGPEEREELPFALLRDAISDGAAEGYSVVGFSGGEPTLYEPLPRLLEHARKLDLTTTVTTNGMLLDPKRLDLLAEHMSLLAISLDGKPESHNRMRAHPRAFELMTQHLAHVHASGVPFGFIFTLTQYNVHELPWVAEFAIDQGAKLLQIHPLEITGRALEELPTGEPDGVEGGFAFLLGAKLQEELGDAIKIQLDLVSRQLLADAPEKFFACEGQCEADAGTTRLADVLSPLIVEMDGTLSPLQFGFSRRHSLGNLYEGGLRELGHKWRNERLAAFQEVCRSAHAGAVLPHDEVPLTNWYDAVRRAAEAA